MEKIRELVLLDMLRSNLGWEKNFLDFLNDLKDFFYEDKNKEMYDLVKKEISGFEKTDNLPDYRKNLKLIFTERTISKGNVANVSKEIESEASIYSRFYLMKEIEYELNFPHDKGKEYTFNKIKDSERALFISRMRDFFIIELEKKERKNFE